VLALLLQATLAGQTTTARGRVVDARTGDPVRGARVQAPGDGSVRTDARGGFAIARSAGNLALQVTKTGYAPAMFLAGTSQGQFVVRLRRAGVLAIRILDEFNEPRRGSVRIVSDPASTGAVMAFQASLDDRGEFRAPGLAPGRYTVRLGGTFGQLLRLPRDMTAADVPRMRDEIRRLAEKEAASATATAFTVDVTEGEETVLVLLDPSPQPDRPVVAATREGAAMVPEGGIPGQTGTAIVRGRMADRLGRPVAGARATIAGSTVSLSGTSDRNGTYEIAGVPDGRFVVSVRQPGFAVVAVGGTPQPLVLTLQPREQRPIDGVLSVAGTVTGRILDEFGDPVHQARVVLLQRTEEESAVPRPAGMAVTDEQGRFAVRAVSPGAYYVFTDGERQHPGEVHLFHPAALSLADARPVQVEDGVDLEPVTLRLNRALGAVLAGVALRADGTPLGGRGLRMTGTEAGGAPVMPRLSRTNRSGAFEFGNVLPGEYELSLQGAVANPGALIPSLLGLAEPPDELSGSVTVRVTGPAPARVTLRADP
jgi:protocatechuate 3,4-dioxygenase beta subunit